MKDGELVENIVFIREYSTYSGKSFFELWPEKDTTGKILYHRIDASNGFGSYVISEEAYSKIRLIAEERILKPNLTGRVTLSTAIGSLKKELSKRLFIKGEEVEITQSISAKICSAAQKSCKKTLEKTTHIFPINLSDGRMNSEFAIGEVKFLSRKVFRKSILGFLQHKQSSSDARYRNDLATALRSYSEFEWFAVVEVKDFEHSIGEQVAKRTLEVALAVLKILLFGARISRIRIATEPEKRHFSTHLYFLEDESFGFTFRQQSKRAYHGLTAFEDMAKGSNNMIFLSSIYPVIQQSLEIEPLTPLGARILNALLWFGNSVDSSNQHVASSKLIVALECLFNTSKDAISDTVCLRATAFFHLAERDNDFDETLKELKRFYNQRSDVFHGQKLIELDGKQLGLQKLREYVVEIIYGFVFYCGPQGINDTLLKLNALDDWLNRAVEAVKEG